MTEDSVEIGPEKENGMKYNSSSTAVNRRRSPDPIAAGLKRLWVDVESEPVPDEFFSLLDFIETRRTPAEGDR